ncbi:hypothetical protein FB567DRAFT_512702 [Paraphoma chrysanthemicola]|uniref:Uncharacterized protein n=1 Tax=Paraphoma chrysanthemicola TaxID=798071 RepID=A0A8K0RIM0_9PLEO|nr:hypothetical protein FB567DRAFT_512702 [Paraphoma chrysanthemicola]
MEEDALLQLRRAQRALRQLSIEWQELERRRSELDAAAEEVRHAEEAATTSLARIRSRKFAKAIQSTLPQELREKIYGHLWHEAGIRRDLRHFLLLGIASGKKYPLDELPHFPLPHFAQPEYMGAAMADEILAHIYKHLFARLSQRVTMEDLADVLTSDPFSRGFRTIDWIRSLKIKWTWSWRDKNKEQAFRRALEILNEHSFAKPITLDITISSYSVWSASWSDTINQLRAFQSAYKVLISKGHTIIIKEDVQNMDVTDYYAMSEETWCKKMDAIVENIELKQSWWDL